MIRSLGLVRIWRFVYITIPSY